MCKLSDLCRASPSSPSSASCVSPQSLSTDETRLHSAGIDLLIASNSSDGVVGQQRVVRELLVSEARVVIVLYGERAWLDLARALNDEMVVLGRFIFATLHSSRWKTSRAYADLWPKFDQLLISVGPRRHQNTSTLNQLNERFAELPFPVHWVTSNPSSHLDCSRSASTVLDDRLQMPLCWRPLLRRAVFEVRLNRKTSSRRLCRICPPQQSLDLSAISPDMNIGSISFAAYLMAQSIRRLVEFNCPGKSQAAEKVKEITAANQSCHHRVSHRSKQILIRASVIHRSMRPRAKNWIIQELRLSS